MYLGDLRHTCTILTETITGYSDTGQETHTTSSVTSKCLFIQPRGTVFDIESGRHVKKTPQILLPATTTISAVKKISTSQPGWAGTYEVISVNPLEDRYSIVGYVCDIEVIDG